MNDLGYLYFPTFEDLKDKVDSALLTFSHKGREILSLFGFYTEMGVTPISQYPIEEAA